MIDLGFYNISEEKIYIGDIPLIVLTPQGIDSDIETIVLYHGWSSMKETQRMRGFILASVGYRVVLPDAINHGERTPLSDYGLHNADKLWDTVFQSIEEWDTLLEGLEKKHGINTDKVGLIGNSMGGIIASGIYSRNNYIKSLVVLNGTMAWENSNKIIKEALNIEMTEELRIIEEKIKEIDPIKNTHLLVNRPILILHGDCDTTLSVESERLFYENINEKYSDKDKIKLVEYPGLNHAVTTNMMEDSIVFFNKYLK